MRAFEVLQYERIEPRLFGWRVSASVMRNASQNGITGNGYSNLYHNAMEYLQFQSDYGYPLSLNTQLAASGTVLVPRKDSKRRVGVTLVGSVIYQMTDRIDASLAYSLNRTSTSFATDDSEDFGRDLYHRVSAGLRFFIENNVTFNVSAGYQYQKSSVFLPRIVGTTTTYSSTTASFGLTYRFL
jgi:opacity protein-like surface antigen